MTFFHVCSCRLSTPLIAELIFLYMQKETLVMEYSCKLNLGVILYCEIMLKKYFQCSVQVKLNRQHLPQKNSSFILKKQKFGSQ